MKKLLPIVIFCCCAAFASAQEIVVAATAALFLDYLRRPEIASLLAHHGFVLPAAGGKSK
jgi:hypothetical protein